MRTRRMIISLCLLVLTGVCSAAPAGEMSEGRYKNYYADGWFGTYALREFDKTAPPPGVNWFVEDAQDWLARAQREGWVVKHKPSEAVNGSIVVGYHEGLVWVGVAREVTDKGLVFETVMGGEGKPARYWMKFADLSSAIHFQGCILPLRTPDAKQVSPMLDYKNIRGASGSAWPVKEFDKSAPKPGFNWQGTEKEWAAEAAAEGWITGKKSSQAKRGSLMILYNRVAKRTKVAYVRDVVDSIIVFELVDPPYSRVITARLTMDQLQDGGALGGYLFDSVILPERKKR